MVEKTHSRILHVLPAYYEGADLTFETIASYGGGERYAAELALATSKYANVTLVTFGTNYLKFYKDNLKIIILKSKPILPKFNSNSEFISLQLLRLARSYDIIHAHKYFTDTTVLLGLLSKTHKKKIFSTDLGFTGLTLSRFLPMHRFIDKLLCLSEYDIERFNLPRNKMNIIYGGVDLNKYKYKKHKDKTVLFLGRLLPHKGVDYIIKSLDSKTHCIIAGHMYDKTYFKYLKQLSKNKNITFMISPTDEDVIKVMRNASVLVLPSVDVDYEGKHHKNPELFGLVIAEAFACGTPVIVSDSSALPFVVTDNKDGYIVRQNDPEQIAEKVQQIFSNRYNAEEMGKAARLKAESLYNWDEVAKRSLKAYQI